MVIKAELLKSALEKDSMCAGLDGLWFIGKAISEKTLYEMAKEIVRENDEDGSLDGMTQKDVEDAAQKALQDCWETVEDGFMFALKDSVEYFFKDWRRENEYKRRMNRTNEIKEALHGTMERFEKVE